MFDEANSFLETNGSIQWSTQNKFISNTIKNLHYSNKTDLLEFGINKLMSFSLESNLRVAISKWKCRLMPSNNKTNILLNSQEPWMWKVTDYPKFGSLDPAEVVGGLQFSIIPSTEIKTFSTRPTLQPKPFCKGRFFSPRIYSIQLSSILCAYYCLRFAPDSLEAVLISWLKVNNCLET